MDIQELKITLRDLFVRDGIFDIPISTQYLMDRDVYSIEVVLITDSELGKYRCTTEVAQECLEYLVDGDALIGHLYLNLKDQYLRESRRVRAHDVGVNELLRESGIF